MDIQLSQRVQKVKPSPTLAITANVAKLRAEGRDIIGLGAGEPDFDTPEHIKAAAVAALKAGKTKYTAVDGLPSLKEAIIDKFRRDNALEYKPDQILVSVGGKQSFYNLAQAYLNPGDEVIIPSPYWVSYPDMVLLAGGEPVVVAGNQDQRFKITAAQLEAAITPKTRMFVINSPSNPAGTAYNKAELIALAEVLLKHPNILIVTDDMYEHIMWTEEPFSNIVMACPGLYDQTAVLNGVSKAYSMTGWRIGYAGGPANLIKAMKKVQSQSTSNPATMCQYAAEEALRGDQSCIAEMNKAFKRRHDLLLKGLNEIDGVECIAGDGTFYLFPSMHGLIKKLGLNNDLELGSYLVDKVGVALVPGSAFGLEGYMRLSFATSDEALTEALARIAKAAKT
ncbi:MAG: pyridoxal phosphate-dependent aminotransferase [Gammaproteobacteria bacterium]|nr:pyridoxal phosphate-dependent aminotransferase [Gammaproteobacteria bacterium]